MILEAIPLLVLVAGTVLVGMTQGSWLSPGVILGGVWIVVISVGLAAAPPAPSPTAIWVATAITLAFAVGTALVPSTGVGNPVELSGHMAERGRQFLRLSVAVLAAAAALGVAALTWYGLGRFGLERSLEGIMQLGNRFSVARYSGTEPDPPLPIRLSQYFQYPAALAGGYLYVTRQRRRDLWLSVLPLLVAAGGAFVVAARSGFLLATFVWLGGAWAAELGPWRTRRTSLRTLLLPILLGGVLIPASFALAWVRLGAPPIDAQILGDMITKFEASLFSYAFAFSEWLHVWNGAPSWGQYTFAGPANALGVADRISGLYEGVVSFKGYEPNIFTAYRGLVQDFTVPGAIAVSGMAGLGSGLIYQGARAGHLPSAAVLSLVYAMLLTTPFYSFFTFNSVWIAWPVFLALWVGYWTIRRPADRRPPAWR